MWIYNNFYKAHLKIFVLFVYNEIKCIFYNILGKNKNIFLTET